ncbi:MAG: glycosyltransferase [Gammaproteobacteria bacterium]
MSVPRILIVHCRYKQPGGEDMVVAAEADLLKLRGHPVWLYERDNRDVDQLNRARLACESIWSGRSSRDISDVLAEFRPDVVHVHNTFPLISPSLYWAVDRAAIPLVQTLHNFRLLCPQAMLLRDGHVCEDCVGKLPWRAVTRRCYRHSAAASGVLAIMLGMHRGLGTFRHKVTRYIALNQFCLRKFVSGGLPAEKLVVKPNFIDLPPPREFPRSGGLYVGRLAPEKGINTLLNGLARLPGTPFTVIGAGPEAATISARPGVSALGWQSQPMIYEHMQRAAYLVIPSIWYENFPRTLVEAFACGLPVIASRLGALAELVHEGKTGLLFEPGSGQDLSDKIAWATAHQDEMAHMGMRARAEYEVYYTPGKNYERLMEIYHDAMASKNRTAAA